MYESQVPIGIANWTAETVASTTADPLFVLDLQGNERACHLRLVTADDSGSVTSLEAVGQKEYDQGWLFSGGVTVNGLTVTVPCPSFSGSQLFAWVELEFTQNYNAEPPQGF